MERTQKKMIAAIAYIALGSALVGWGIGRCSQKEPVPIEKIVCYDTETGDEIRTKYPEYRNNIECRLVEE